MVIRQLTIIGFVLVLSACTSDTAAPEAEDSTAPTQEDASSDQSSSDPSQAEFDERMDGVASDPDGFELTVVECVNDGEFIDYSWGITNTSSERRTYASVSYTHLTLPTNREV